MVSDFVPADYRWPHSPDKSKEARVIFKAGKNCEGYPTNNDILNQTTTAIDIFTEFYSKEEHILVYDNAMTHTKCSDTVLLVHHMPKGTKPVGEFWGATISVLDSDGQQVYQQDKDRKFTQKPKKIKLHIDDTQLAVGSPQTLYFPDNHLTSLGCFKGMCKGTRGDSGGCPVCFSYFLYLSYIFPHFISFYSSFSMIFPYFITNFPFLLHLCMLTVLYLEVEYPFQHLPLGMMSFSSLDLPISVFFYF
ncbi:hypothetical protein L208DRAFT_1275219 [Tricholoma matsutake]|nr:hypothetical protein L208DRAFT_1275219 [Tricholoma matsutake 945]